MNLADRVKDTSTSTGTGNFVLSGTPATGFQALSAIGSTGATFGYVIDGGAEWEVGTGTITAANTFSRAPSASSNAGALVNFSAGTKTVFNDVTAAQYAKFQTTNTAAFATAIPLTAVGATYMPQQTVSSVLAFTVGASPVQGALAYLRLVADGTNAPTFTGYKEWGGSLGYDNRNGIVNELQFFYDGYDSWYSISQAVGAVAIPPAATGVTMTGPTGGVNGVASTNFTLGVTPVGGTITGTVVVTPSDGGAGGTFTPASNSLTSGSPSGTFTYTPASTGAKTISVTNNGGLSNPSNITYTATAAATVPATMAAPVATAGDTTASIAYVVPSDGGSAITGYTVTPYLGATAQTPQTFGVGAGPVTATGLTNGSAYTFKMHASNTVGAGTDSPASNSVTPVAASSALRALAGFTMLTESGSDPNWAYAGTGGGAFDATGAVFNKGLASSALGSFSCVRATAASLSIQPALSAIAGTSPLALASRVGTLLHGSGGPYMVYLGSTSQTVANTVNALVGDWMRIRRSATTTLVYEVSQDSGSTWVTIFTQTGAPSTALNFQLQIIGPGASLVNGLTGVGLS